MTSLTLYEDHGFVNLLPLVYWRTVFELRLGRRILLDRIAQHLGMPVSGVWSRDWIADVAAKRCGAPANQPVRADTLLVNGRWVCPRPVDVAPAPCVGMSDDAIAYIHCDDALAARLTPQSLLDAPASRELLQDVPRVEAPGWHVRYPWDLVLRVGEALKDDFQPKDAGVDVELDSRVILESPDAIHIGQKAFVHPTCVIDAREGPIFIGENVYIGPYCVIEGPAYIGPGTRINPHTHLYGANSIGPACKIGGEVNGCAIQGYTNKQHSGFLGHSYVGSWVNIGAGTSNSNLKNTYGHVRVPINNYEVDTGARFFGAVIGDHVKTAIHTTIPTGAVIGTASVIATGSTMPKFVPPFAWLTDEGASRGDPARLLDIADTVTSRRGVTMTEAERRLFLDIPERAATFE